jgi:hypothetical protein
VKRPQVIDPSPAAPTKRSANGAFARFHRQHIHQRRIIHQTGVGDHDPLGHRFVRRVYQHCHRLQRAIGVALERQQALGLDQTEIADA